MAFKVVSRPNESGADTGVAEAAPKFRVVNRPGELPKLPPVSVDMDAAASIVPQPSAAPAQPTAATVDGAEPFQIAEPPEAETAIDLQPQIDLEAIRNPPKPPDIGGYAEILAPPGYKFTDRGESAMGSAAQGAADFAAGTVKDVAIQGARMSHELVPYFDMVDKGEKVYSGIIPRGQIGVIRMYERASPEERASLKRQAQIADPRGSALYQAGDTISQTVKEAAPTDPAYQGEFVADVLPRGGGSMAAFVAGSVAARAIGVPTVAASAGLGAAASGAQQFEDALAKGADMGTAFRAAGFANLLGTTEAAPIASLLNRFNRATGGQLQNYAIEILKQGGEEALQEFIQGFGQNAIAQGLYDPERDLLTGTGEGAAAGFVLGAGMQFLTGMAGAGLRRAQIKRDLDFDPTLSDAEREIAADIAREQFNPNPITSDYQPADFGQAAEAAPGTAAQPAAEAVQTVATEPVSPAVITNPIEPAPPQPERGDLEAMLNDPRPLAEIEAEKAAQAAQAQAEQEMASQELLAQINAPAAGTVAYATLPDGVAPVRGVVMGAEEYNDKPYIRMMIDGEAVLVSAADVNLTVGDGTRAAPVKANTAQDMEIAAANVDPNPTPAQKEAENYAMGHLSWNGLDISIETPRGGTRTAADGSWSVPDFPAHYGRVKGTTGADGDHVDIYMGNRPESATAFVIDQINPETGEFDEHKVMLGFASLADAKATYAAAFNDGQGPARMGAVTPMNVDRFKAWLKNEDTKKPVAYKEPPYLPATHTAGYGSPAQQKNVLTRAQKKLAGKYGNRVTVVNRGGMNVLSLRGATRAEDAAVAEEVQRQSQIKVEEVQRARQRGGPTFNRPIDIMEFLASIGGISNDGGELKNGDLDKVFIGGFGRLVTKNGMSLDEARELAQEAGYLNPDDPNAAAESRIDDLLELIDETHRGNRKFSRFDAAEVENMRAEQEAEDQNRRYKEAVEEVEEYATSIGARLTQAETTAAVSMIQSGVPLEDAIGEVIERHGIADEVDFAENAERAQESGEHEFDIPFASAPEAAYAGNEGGLGATSEAPFGQANEPGRGPAQGGPPSGGEPRSPEQGRSQEDEEEVAPAPEAGVSDSGPTTDAQKAAEIARQQTERWRESVADLVGKQPYEMTASEWARAQQLMKRAIKNSSGMDMTGLNAATQAFEDTFGYDPNGGTGNSRHEVIVLHALRDGKAVPENVRAEYRGKEGDAFSFERRNADEFAELLSAETANLPATGFEGQMFVQIGTTRYEIGSLAQASEKFEAARDEAWRQGATSEDLPRPLITDANGNVIGHISQNGRVWSGKPADWKAGDEPAYDNRDADVDEQFSDGERPVGPSATMQAEDTDAELQVTLTEAGPWDFNDTFPQPDPFKNDARANEGRDNLADTDVEGIVATLGEWINEGSEYQSGINVLEDDILRMERKESPVHFRVGKRRATPADIEKARAGLATAEQSFEDWQGEIGNYFNDAATAAIVEEAQRAAVQRQVKDAAPSIKPRAEESRVADDDERDAAAQPRNDGPALNIDAAAEALMNILDSSYDGDPMRATGGFGTLPNGTFIHWSSTKDYAENHVDGAPRKKGLLQIRDEYGNAFSWPLKAFDPKEWGDKGPPDATTKGAAEAFLMGEMGFKDDDKMAAVIKKATVYRPIAGGPAFYSRSELRKLAKANPPEDAGDDIKPRTPATDTVIAPDGKTREQQAVIPGAEQQGTGAAKAAQETRAQAEARLRGQQSKMRRGGQKSVQDMDGGLFGDRGDLFATPKATKPEPSEAPAERKPATEADANRAMESLRTYMGKSQWAAVRSGMRGEEKQFFRDKMVELADRIANMPKTYEQDGKGDDAIVSLHYFTSGGDWYITEKDMEAEQHQAFGLADPFQDGGELGYISIIELAENGAELDFYFTPKTLGEVRGKKAAPKDDGAPASDTRPVDVEGDYATKEKALDKLIAASKAAGDNLSTRDLSVEGMRGLQIESMWNGDRGVVMTVDNRGDVYIGWETGELANQAEMDTERSGNLDRYRVTGRVDDYSKWKKAREKKNAPKAAPKPAASAPKQETDDERAANSPTWAEIMSSLPKDAQGRADMELAAKLMFEITGKKQPGYKDLSTDQRYEMLDRTKAAAEEATKAASYGTDNKIFTKSAADAAREILRKKLGGSTLNVGIDPELMVAGLQLAGYHIEAGARSFAAYSKAMIEDMGEGIRPFLRSFYDAVRSYPGFDAAGMDSAAEIDAAGTVDETAENSAPVAEPSDKAKDDFIAKLEKTGAARTGDADYSIQQVGDKGSFYYRKVEKGVAIEQGPGYPARWSRDKAIEEAAAEAFPENDAKSPPKVIEPAPVEHPGLVIKSLETGKETTIQPTGTVAKSRVGGGLKATLAGEPPAWFSERTQEGRRQLAIAAGFGEADAAWVSKLNWPNLSRWNDSVALLQAAAERDATNTAQPAKVKAKEDSNGVQNSLFGSDENAGAGNVRRAEADRKTGGTRGSEGGGSQPDVQRPDRKATETAQRPAEGPGSNTGSRGTGVRDTDRLSQPERDAGDVKGANFSIEKGALQEGRSWRQKALDNIRAIELMREINAQGRPATRDEQNELALYVGWGGIKGAFPDAKGEYGQGFKEIGARVKDLLSEAEYRTAERTIQYAHFTSEKIVRSMWDIAVRLGFKGGKVFEPGMGVGNFAGMMPADIAAATNYSGLEFDHTTADIARLLYPQWGVRRDDFTKAPLPKNTYDLVIGNPPFSDTPIKSDPAYASHSFLMHDFFFAKSMDSVRPGGLLIFITSAGTMNKIDAKAREYLAERADFVGAIRLPGEAFSQNAGTEVTTDIIILKKRAEGEPASDNRRWIETTNVTLKDRLGADKTGAVNAYFVDHPEMVLGEEGFFDKLYPGRYGVHAIKGEDLGKRLEQAIDTLPENIMSEWKDTTERAEEDFGTSERKEDSYYIASGKLMQRRNGVGVPVANRGKGVEGGMTAAQIERIRALVPIRDSLRAVYAADLADDTENAAKARTRLNSAYDAFNAKFGPINKAEISYRRPNSIQQESARNEAREEARFNGTTFDEGSFDPSRMIRDGKSLSEISKARRAKKEEFALTGKDWDEGSFDPDDMPDIIIDKRPNIDPFMDDPESYRLRAIEHYDDSTGEAKKSAVFFQNVISREREPEINSVGDALLYVLNKHGRLDLVEVAHAAGVSQETAIEQLGEAIFRVPGTQDTWQTRETYLSGNVRAKLRTAIAAAERDSSLARNVSALEAAQPSPLPPSEIAANLGMPWIPPEVIEQFGKDIGLESLNVRYVAALGQWFVSGDTDSPAASQTWGTLDRRAPALISDALNRQDPKIYSDYPKDGGGTEKRLNPDATQAVQDKVRELKDRFSEWMWTDPKRSAEMAKLYNEEYNNLVVPEYDGSYLTTPGIAASWSWRPHQKRVIARIIQNGNTYIAHAVGAGKTSEMIAAGMEMRRLGLVRKPMYSVPNHMLGQFTKEFYEQYPTARIAVADERRFHTDKRKQFIANVATDDLDAIIITHSAMGLIPVSVDFQDALLQEQIDQYRDLLSEIDDGDPDNRITRSRMQNRIEKLEQRLSGRGKKQDAVFTFEEMGVDFLFVDEAHEFRKLDFATKMGGIKGISPEGSKAAFDLYVKTRYLETINPGRNLVMASGTPVTNTMAELYTISRYMQSGELAQRGLLHFDAWAGAFGDTKTELEQNAAGTYGPATRFAKFENIPELSAMVRQVMDVVTSRQLTQYVVIPKLKGGERKMNLAPRTDQMEAFQRGLERRMDAIAERRGKPQKGDDILLTVINDGRHAAIDMRLVDPNLPNDKDSKLNLLVDNVYRIWSETKRQPLYKTANGKYDDKPADIGPATQMIFANLGIGTAREFNVYKYIVSELQRRGVPRDEIAVIGDYKTTVARQRLFNDMNEGVVRILMGSVGKMGTGVNAQRRLIAIHNLDPLWYPSDDEQRNGRGLRQGNMNPEIEINDYATEGTYDSVMFGMMERKARFIQQFFEGDPALRSMEDLGEASVYAQAKAITTADPRLIKLTEYKQDLERARRRKAAFEREQYANRDRIETAQRNLDRAEELIPAIEKDIAQRIDTRGDNFKGKIGKKSYDERVEFGDHLLEQIAALREGAKERDRVEIGELGGFKIMADVYQSQWDRGEEKDKPWYVNLYFNRNGGTSDINFSSSALGSVQSAESVLRNFEDGLESYIRKAEAARKIIKDFGGQEEKTFAGQAQIDELVKKVADLERELAPPPPKAAQHQAVPADPAEIKLHSEAARPKAPTPSTPSNPASILLSGRGAVLPNAPDNKGPHYAAGRSAKAKGEPRVLPSYFTDNWNRNKNVNADAWYAGWDEGTAPETSPATPATPAPAAAPATGGDIEFKLAEMNHTKTGAKIYVATLGGRVEKDEYNRLNGIAKRFGPGYSSYAKQGAIAGFHFPTEEKRQAFLDTVNGGPKFSQPKGDAFPSASSNSWFKNPKGFFEGERDKAAPTKAPAAPRELAEPGADEQVGISADLGRIIKIMGPKLYSSDMPQVTMKELVQNAFDGVKAAQNAGTLEEEPEINIHYDRTARTLTMSDSGAGMTAATVKDAFLTVAGTNKDGLSPDQASGGFGIAKLAFIFGNDGLKLRTVRNGVAVELETTGEELMAGKADLKQSKTRDTDGTTVTITFPKTYRGSDGETKDLYLPYLTGFEILRKPLIGDVNVWAKEGKNKPAELPLGANMDMSQLPKVTTARFPWGDVDVYFGNIKQDSAWAADHTVLSAGLWQFDTNIRDQPGFQGDKIAYRIIMDVRSKVPPESEYYPFNNQREDWSKKVTTDIGALTHYIRMLNWSRGADSVGSTFARLELMSETTDGAEFKALDLNTEIPKAKAVEFEKTPEITIKDGKLTIGDREISTGENPNKLEDMRVPDEAVRELPPVFHSNLNVDIIAEASKRSGIAADRLREFFFRIGKVAEQFRDGLGEISGNEYRAYRESTEDGRPVGVSIDKNYGGIHIKVPYQGFFINPFYAPFVGKQTTPNAKAGSLMHTLYHEAIHENEGGHNESFTSKLASLYGDFEEVNPGLEDKLKGELAAIFREMRAEHDALKEVYDDAATKNVETSDGKKSQSVRNGGDSRNAPGDAPAAQSRARDAGRGREDAGQAEGRRAAQDAPGGVDSPAFKRWFGDSVVVDENGNPLVVYHGTTGDIEAFDKREGRFNGTFFTASPHLAGKYATFSDDVDNAGRGGANVIPVYLRMVKPLIHDAKGRSFNESQIQRLVDKAEANTFAYDGLIIENMVDTEGEPETQFIAFRPEQIKSATGNNGNFDPNDDRIQYSLSRSDRPFFSALFEGLGDVKVTKGPAAQWRGIVSNLTQKGVKQEEIDWSGIMDFLDDAKGTIEKADIYHYLTANQTKIVEVVKTEGARPTKAQIDAMKDWLKDNGDYGAMEREMVDNAANGDRLALGDLEGYEAPEDLMAPFYQGQGVKFGPNSHPRQSLPGGENYRELLLTLPAKDTVTREPSKAPAGWGDTDGGDIGYVERGNNRQDYRGGHFDEPNVVVHIRFNERTDADGKRVLFIEEIQSDWHQTGRKRGYGKTKPIFEVRNKFGNLESVHASRAEAESKIANRRFPNIDKADDYLIVETATPDGVPDGPFKKTWHELAFRRMVRWAAENGLDKLAWTTGEQQADRYDLSKQVDQIRYIKNDDGTWDVWASNEYGQSVSDEIEARGNRIKEDSIEQLVGKDVAKKIVDGQGRQDDGDMVLEGENLKVGGEGMKGFYDKILPAYASKFGKKFGAKVGTSRIDGASRYNVVQRGRSSWRIVDMETATGEYIGPPFGSSAEADAYIADTGLPDSNAHSIDITPEMRATAMKGLPMFARKAATQERMKIGERGGFTPGLLDPKAPDYAETVRRALMTRLAELGIDTKVALKTVDAIFDENGEQVGSIGSYHRRLIEIVLGSPMKGWVLNHEAIHALRDLDLLTTAEWAALERAAKADTARIADIRERYARHSISEEKITEEAIADMFADWGAQKTRVNGPALRALNLIKKFLDALGNALRGNGFRTAQDVFEAIDRGEVGARESGTTVSDSNDVQYAIPRRRQGNLLGANWSAPSQSAWDILADKNLTMVERLKGSTATATDIARQRLQDRFLPVLRVQEAIVRARGGAELDQNVNAYLAEELFYGRTGKQLDDFERKRVTPMIEAIKAEDLTIKDVEEYLYARHAEERNKQIASINDALPDGGSGMMTAEANAILARFDADKKTAKLEKIAKLVDRILAESVDTRLAAGLMDQKTAMIWKKTYQHYVPLRGFEEIDPDEGTVARPRTGSGFDIRGPESKQALGRESKAGDILANVISMAQESIVRAEKNNVGKTFLRLVQQNPNEDVWEISKVEYGPRINKKSGMVELAPDPRYTLKDNVVAVKVDGKVFHITMHHKGLAQAMKRLGAENANMLIRGLQRVNRWLAFINTSASPEFIISNFARDLQTAGINLQGIDETKGIRWRIMRDVPRAMRGTLQGLHGEEHAKWAAWFQEYARAGGKTEFFALDDITAQRKKIEAMLRQLDPTVLNRTRGAAMAVEKMIQDVNSAVENGVRLSTYANLRRMGVDEKKAASFVKNLTVNFNRKGEWAGTAQALYLFYNASLQGTVRLMQALGHRRVQKVVVGIIMANMVLDILNGLMSPEDDDGEKKYDKISDYTRNHNIIIMAPWAQKGDHKDGIAAKIPMPYGYNVFAVMGKVMGSAIRSAMGIGAKKFDPMKSAMDVLAVAVGAFNPLGADQSLLKTIIPTVLKPYYEHEMNKNFAGTPIRPEQPSYGPEKPDSELHFRSVNPAVKSFTTWLNEATGGNSVRPGAISVSPETIEHIFQFIFGATGAFAARTGTSAYRVATGKTEDMTWNDVPFARRVVEGNSQSYTQRRYYEIKDASELAVIDLKRLAQAGDKAAMDKARKEYAPELAVNKLIDRQDKLLAQMRKTRNTIEGAKDLTTEEREKRIRELEAKMRVVMTPAIRAYNDLVKSKGKPAEPKKAAGDSPAK